MLGFFYELMLLFLLNKCEIFWGFLGSNKVMVWKINKYSYGGFLFDIIYLYIL